MEDHRTLSSDYNHSSQPFICNVALITHGLWGWEVLDKLGKLAEEPASLQIPGNRNPGWLKTFQYNCSGVTHVPVSYPSPMLKK